METTNTVMSQYKSLLKKNWHYWQLLSRYSQINIVLLDQILVSGVNFLTGILMARYLGIEEFGRFTLIWMIVLFFQSLQNALIISPMMSIGPKQNTDKESSYYGVILTQQILFTFLSSIFVIILFSICNTFYPSWHLDGLLMPILASVIFSQHQELLRRYFFTRRISNFAFLNDLISYLGQLILLFILFSYTKATTINVLWIISGTSALAVLAGTGIVRRLNFSWEENKQVLKRHWGSSKWLLNSTLLLWVSGNLMIIMSGMLLGNAAVGILKACQNILGVTHILFNALANWVPVQASKLLHQENFKAMEQYLLKTTKTGGIITFILTMPAIFFPTITLIFLYGNNFKSHQWILFSYALVYLIMFINQMLTFALRAVENTQPIFFGYLATALISICIAYPTIKYFGIQGVIIGMLSLTVINCSILSWGYYIKRIHSFQREVTQ